MSVNEMVLKTKVSTNGYQGNDPNKSPPFLQTLNPKKHSNH